MSKSIFLLVDRIYMYGTFVVYSIPSEFAETVFSDNNSGEFSGSISTMCHKYIFTYFFLNLFSLHLECLKCYVYFYVLLLIAYTQTIEGVESATCWGSYTRALSL